MKGVSKVFLRWDAAAVGGKPSTKSEGTKRRRVMKSGADEALEDEDAEEVDDAEEIVSARLSPYALGLLSAAPLASKWSVRAMNCSRLPGDGHRHQSCLSKSDPALLLLRSAVDETERDT